MDEQRAADFLNRSALLRDAYDVARTVHGGQVEESDGQPYVEHPLEVARLLYETGLDDEVVAAGLLHDTLERSELTDAELRDRFGERVAALVVAMTEPGDVEPFRARKEALRKQVALAGPDAEALMAADKISKSSSLRRALARLGEDEVARRVSNPLDAKLDHYQASLEQLERLASDLPLTSRLQRELNAIEHQRKLGSELLLARRAVAALSARDADALIALCDPGIVWWPALTLGMGGGPYTGHGGVRAYLRDLDRAWSTLSVDLEEARAVGNRLIATCMIDGIGRRSGERLHRAAAVLLRVTEGRVSAARTLLAAMAPV